MQIKETKQRTKNQNKCNMVIKSFILNIHIWILFIVCVFIIKLKTISQFTSKFKVINNLCMLIYSMKDITLLSIFSYIIHYFSHTYRNIFTIIHHYHHETNNKILGDLLQIGLEFLAAVSCVLIMDLNPFTVLQFFLIYTTIHNVNYGYYHVNSVHEEHHNNTMINIGPDICDVIFNTKTHKQIQTEHTIQNQNYTNITEKIWDFLKTKITNKYDDEQVDIEDISHIIPNILLSTIVILIITELWKYPRNKNWMTISFISLSCISFFVYILCSIVLFIQDTHSDKTLFF